jgi:hypothetical protein
VISIRVSYGSCRRGKEAQSSSAPSPGSMWIELGVLPLRHKGQTMVDLGRVTCPVAISWLASTLIRRP